VVADPTSAIAETYRAIARRIWERIATSGGERPAPRILVQ
jgi:hypothetical protein